MKTQTITFLENRAGEDTVLTSIRDDGVDVPNMTTSYSAKRISFQVDSILNAVIQDSDVMELLHILRYQISEFDMNQRNHTGLTALHYAVLTNNLDSVKLLLNHGANVNAQDEYGFSPLHTAAALGFLQVTTMLIVHGADVFSLTNHSELPIDLAKDLSVIRVLLNEMCIKHQSEQYITSLISLTMRTTCAIMYKHILFILKGFVFLMIFLFQKCSEFSRKISTKQFASSQEKVDSELNKGNSDIQDNAREMLNKKSK